MLPGVHALLRAPLSPTCPSSKHCRLCAASRRQARKGGTCHKADPSVSGWAPRPQASLACAVLLGVAMAEVGVSVMHDANHGAGGAGARGVLGATLDMVLCPCIVTSGSLQGLYGHK